MEHMEDIKDVGDNNQANVGIFTIGTSVWRSSSRRLGSRLMANDLMSTIFISLFFFISVFSPVSSIVTFSHKRSAWIKKLI